jgi:hypothetical protein
MSAPSSGTKNTPSKKPKCRRALLATCFLLGSWSSYFSTQSMEATFSPETSVRHIIEEGTLHKVALNLK